MGEWLVPQAPPSGSPKERAIETGWSFFLVGMVGFLYSIGIGVVATSLAPAADYIIGITFTEIFLLTCLGFLLVGVAMLGLVGAGVHWAPIGDNLVTIREEFGRLLGEEERLKARAVAKGDEVKRLEAELARAKDEYKTTMEQLDGVGTKKNTLRKRFDEES